VSALAWYIESEGIQTTGISLVRENSEALKPPRFLWTTFRLGRPLGVPGDAAFQHRVIRAALALLDRAGGPVLEDYPEDAPAVDAAESVACPVSFPPPPREPTSWAARLAGEMDTLRPWYEASLRRRGRTTVGIANQPVDALAHALAAALDASEPPGPGRALKDAAEDLKAWYLEALTAQPGSHDPVALHDTLWRETELGRALKALHHIYAKHPDAALRPMARGIAPRGALAD
jgi:D-proline reductase (dithiol) PrdB